MHAIPFPRSRFLFASLVVSTMALGQIACDNTAKGVAEDFKDNAAVVEKDAEKVRQDSRVIGEKFAEGARTTGENVTAGALELSDDAKAAKQTMEVKAALMADKSVDASDINVDTTAVNKTLTLNGTVATRAQKSAAERIAKEKSEGYTVKNLLKVRS